MKFIAYGYANEIGGVITPPESPNAMGASTFPGYAFAMPSASRRQEEAPTSPPGTMPSGVMGRALARSMGDDKPKRVKSATASVPKSKSGVLRLLGRKDTNAGDENASSFMDMSRR